MSIAIEKISKTFGSFTALWDISLTVPTGALVAVLGPSGSGKTTLLRIIAGLEQPDAKSGAIYFHDEDVRARHVRERRVGFVFQHYALFRHMTVFDNVAFGLRVLPRKSRPSRADIQDKVHRLLQLVQLHGLASRYPHQLSGGQRQRVALARALAIEPKVLLLDEPFGALDAKVRQELRTWLRRLHDDLHVTSVFVTHDQSEALEVADHVVIMNHGRIEQIGTPDEVFHQPQTEFVMNFLGSVNCFHGQVQDGQVILGSVTLNLPDGVYEDGTPARLLVRPQGLQVQTRPNGSCTLPAHITHIKSAGPVVKVELLSEVGQTCYVEIPYERFQRLPLTAGTPVFLNMQDVHVFVGDTDH
jgi:sulfate/thiosulfate transport system ATP-binding protein